jgi:hypothetical protein
MTDQSRKPYPSTFNELVDQFNNLDVNNTDGLGNQCEHENNPYQGCKQIEYPLDEPISYGEDLFVVLKYKDNYYQTSFDEHEITGCMTQEVYEKHKDDFDEEISCAGEWIDVETEQLTNGTYSFTIPSFVQLVDQENDIEQEMVYLKEEDSKVVLEGLYGFNRKLLDEEGFTIESFYDG